MILKYATPDNLVIIVDGVLYVPVDPDNADYQRIVESGLPILIADPVPAPLTNQELIDLAGPVLVAFLRAYAQREGLTMTQIKNAIVAEM